MRDIVNFNAGPAMLPEEVLLQAQEEMLNWQQTGMSLMEIGHRTNQFKHLAEQSEADLRELLAIPTNYKVFFIAGGATTQFAMVPLNLFGKKTSADYVDTGVWSKKAIAEAQRYNAVHIVAQTQYEDGLAYITHQDKWSLDKHAAYVHFTPNETIEGIQFRWVPKTGDVPLVADMTSLILSEPIAVQDYGIIYAGAQKNLGQAGITVAIVREDLIKEPLPNTPTLYAYKTYAETQSLYNTPPTYAWYILSLVLQWTKKQGGVAKMAEVNQRKANTLYAVIDAYKDFYLCKVRADYRSVTNVMFYLRDESLTLTFLAEAEKIGLYNLRGHRVSGGIRASIYNAMPESAVEKLAEFMREFLHRFG